MSMRKNLLKSQMTPSLSHSGTSASAISSGRPSGKLFFGTAQNSCDNPAPCVRVLLSVRNYSLNTRALTRLAVSRKSMYAWTCAGSSTLMVLWPLRLYARSAVFACSIETTVLSRRAGSDRFLEEAIAETTPVAVSDTETLCLRRDACGSLRYGDEANKRELEQKLLRVQAEPIIRVEMMVMLMMIISIIIISIVMPEVEIKSPSRRCKHRFLGQRILCYPVVRRVGPGSTQLLLPNRLFCIVCC